ncbi:helix-turn-helix domain-containing protein [Phenylobacterium sp. NIBR 498073]|uniref:helix-turn-helix domain-containing protein n=1 Tax=Phenylobacterium sp. NIBR 498073 TaxID=3015177 RepID=UPI0022B46BB8|nr:helix-turn-helix domain-containing protein [Phenylobacterium sp. NIBR 498073]WGU38769.1 helix-turn-helix domain-containing protein [Phenylobacterium sp. NIBR 498073]
MDASRGELVLSQPIPRVRHAILPGETRLDLARRMAQSVAFAFSIDPARTAAQPDFDFSAEALVLPEAVVARSRVRGRIAMTREAALIAATGADQLFVYVIVDGEFDVKPTRSGRRLRGGDILIIDLAQAVTLLGADYGAIMMVLARGALPDPLRRLDLHGAEIRGDHPLARTIVSTLACLCEDAPRMTQAQGSVVLRAAIEMLGLALTDVRRTRTAPRALKAMAEALVDDHLDDPALSPAWIAGRLDVSRATLYRAFAAYGGVTRFIDDRRSQQAWVLLTSAGDLSLGEIAARCGYPGRTRLVQAFSERFAVSPETVLSASEDDRAMLQEQAARAMMDAWDRRTGRSER